MDTDNTSKRACGSRAAGGVYAETRLSDGGQPIEYFLVDPPKPVLDELGLTAVGVKLINVDGVWHIFDVVGAEYYPYPADYVEETRRKGASRRLPRNLEFDLISAESRLVLVHSKAVIQNFSEYPQPPEVECPKAIVSHQCAPLPEMCAGLWWHDLPLSELEPGADGRFIRKIQGGTTYHARPRPAGIAPQYQHAIFMMLPITNLAIIQGRNAQENASAEQAFQAASQSGLPVYLEEE